MREAKRNECTPPPPCSAASVLAFDPNRKSNADLILDAASLGYIGDRVLDATYGKGNFWVKHKPVELVKNDIRIEGVDHRWDWLTETPQEFVDAFDTVVFDPPYKLCGTVQEADQMRWGLGFDAYRSVKSRIEDMELGLRNCAKAVRPGGSLLVKSQDQVANHRVHWLSESLSPQAMRKVDELYLVSTPRTQRTQKHSRRNYSTLAIFVKV